MKIGFHLPISGGFLKVRDEARRLGCEVVQVFVRNPRSWADKELTGREKDEFRALAEEFPVYGHLSYLPNLAKIDEDPRNLEGLLSEARLCEFLGIERLVVHCGSHRDREHGLAMVVGAVNTVLSRHPVTILLENSAGQGNSVGRTVEELAVIMAGVDEKGRVALCLDTAHLFAAGYDVRLKTSWNRIVKEVNRLAGKEKIALFHLNDSKSDLGSSVDRHWHIGQGSIGPSAFRILVNDKRFAHLHGVMETPKMGNMDEENMRTMKSYFLL